MKKVLLAVMIIAVLMFAVACNPAGDGLEKEIKNSALCELGISADTPSELIFISSESVKWSDYDYYVYELTVNGHTYRVGVNRNEKEIHNVDVEKEL